MVVDSDDDDLLLLLSSLPPPPNVSLLRASTMEKEIMVRVKMEGRLVCKQNGVWSKPHRSMMAKYSQTSMLEESLFVPKLGLQFVVKAIKDFLLEGTRKCK